MPLITEQPKNPEVIPQPDSSNYTADNIGTSRHASKTVAVQESPELQCANLPAGDIGGKPLNETCITSVVDGETAPVITGSTSSPGKLSSIPGNSAESLPPHKPDLVHLVQIAKDLLLKQDHHNPLPKVTAVSIDRIAKAGDINDTIWRGLTPLMSSMFINCGNEHIEEHAEYIKALVKCGAKLDSVDEYGGTALIIACEERRPEFVKILVDAGAKLDITNKKGMSALMIMSTHTTKADTSSDLEILEELLNANASVNLVNEMSGDTALHYAVEHARLPTALFSRDWVKVILHSNPCQKVKLLLEYGANINQANKQNVTPLGVLRANSFPPVVDSLLAVKPITTLQ